MNLKKSRLAIIGAGNIGVSIAKGLIAEGKINPKNISLSKRRGDFDSALVKEGCVCQFDNLKASKDADIVLLAVLPQQFDTLAQQLKGKMKKDVLVISVMTGISVEVLRSKLSVKSVVRAMPNTAIAVRSSMTCIAADKNSAEGVAITKEIFNSVGEVIEIKEELMTSATALCACGTAFFLRAIRAASQGGIEIGFHSDEALKMAAQTAFGAAKLLLEFGTHPEREIDKVTSPEGCTIAGLNEMEHQGFSSAMIKGIRISSDKAKILYKPKS